MTLNNYQFQFGNFQFGGAGSPFQIIELNGLAGLPSLRVQDDNRGYNDGALTGRDFYDGRTITFTVHIFAGNGNSAHDNLELLQRSLIPQQTGTTSLRFLLSQTDTEKIIDARVRSRVINIDPNYAYGYIRAQISMFAPDPRYYDNALQTVTIFPSGLLSGRTYNRTYDMIYGYVSPNNTAQITNTGTIYTSPVVTISGPVTNPVFGYTEANKFIQVAATLTAADQLVIDLNNKIVTLNNSPVRNLMTVDSEWFTIAADTTATFYLQGSVITNGTTKVAVNWRNAYI